MILLHIRSVSRYLDGLGTLILMCGTLAFNWSEQLDSHLSPTRMEHLPLLKSKRCPADEQAVLTFRGKRLMFT